MDLGFSNKRVIVTGGSRGIGHATAQTLINEGAAVATCARGEDALNAALAVWRGASQFSFLFLGLVVRSRAVAYLHSS